MLTAQHIKTLMEKHANENLFRKDTQSNALIAHALQNKSKQKKLKLDGKHGVVKMAKRGLYANIHAKRKRIEAGSKEKMRKKGDKGAPTDKNFKQAAKTAKKYVKRKRY